MQHIEDIRLKMRALHVNTLLTPVYWEIIEPQENVFDFSLVDALINKARIYDIKFVFLWFGCWKNSMNCYVPEWVKTNQERFPRAKSREGISQEILSPFTEANLQAELKAYNELLRHIAEIDSKEDPDRK